MAQVRVFVGARTQHRQERTGRVHAAKLAQGDRREEANARALIAEQGDKLVERLGFFSPRRRPWPSARYLRVRIIEQGFERGPLTGAMAVADGPASLAQAPDGVDPWQRLTRRPGHLGEGFPAFSSPASQLELRFLANPHVRVFEQLGQCVIRPVRHPLGQHRLDLAHARVIAPRRVEHPVDPPLPGHFPAFDPVTEIKRSVGPEIDVGREHRPDELPRDP